MKSLTTRKLAIGAASVALLGGAGGALAATQSSAGSGRQAYLDDVAKRLNVSPGALTSAVKAARNDRIEAALAAGRITRSQADALKERAQQGAGALLPGHRFGARGLGVRGVAAQYLGLTRATLRGELQSGKSLAQIAATTPGRSVEGLKGAIEGAAKARLAKAVAGGLLTGEQEQERLTHLSSRLDALLKRTSVGAPNAPQGFGPLGSR
jgi:hypothetical protein